MVKDFIQYFSEVRSELGKVVWPSVNELIGSAIIVLILVCLFALYLGALDIIFYRIAERIF